MSPEATRLSPKATRLGEGEKMGPSLERVA